MKLNDLVDSARAMALPPLPEMVPPFATSNSRAGLPAPLDFAVPTFKATPNACDAHTVLMVAAVLGSGFKSVHAEGIVAVADGDVALAVVVVVATAIALDSELSLFSVVRFDTAVAVDDDEGVGPPPPSPPAAAAVRLACFLASFSAFLASFFSSPLEGPPLPSSLILSVGCAVSQSGYGNLRFVAERW